MNDDLDSTRFEPEVILPAQMSWGMRGDGNMSGARGLMLAILEDALRCIERGRRRRHPGTRQLATDAEKWMHADSRDWLFSFVSICDLLGLDADALRGRVGANTERPGNGGRTGRCAAEPTAVGVGAYRSPAARAKEVITC